MSEKIIITIARQYGSGGREIGERVAALLGIPVYDRELITLSAKESGLDTSAVEKADEKATNSLLYTLALGSNSFGTMGHFGYQMPLNDRLFVLQSDVIRGLAEKGSCVLIGRAADYVLRDDPARFSVFVYADEADRKARVVERHENVSEQKAIELMTKTDRRRASYYNYYTGYKWGKLDRYHLAVSSSFLGIEGTARMIADAARARMEKA